MEADAAERQREFRRCAKLYALAYIVPALSVTILLALGLTLKLAGIKIIGGTLMTLGYCLAPFASFIFFKRIPLEKHIKNSFLRFAFIATFTVAVFVPQGILFMLLFPKGFVP